MLFNASMELMLYNLELHNSIAVVIKITVLESVDICHSLSYYMNKTFNMGSFHPVLVIWIYISIFLVFNQFCYEKIWIELNNNS